MDPVRATLRLGILNAAREQYDAMASATQATGNERKLFALFAMECELWAAEVLATVGARPLRENEDGIE